MDEDPQLETDRQTKVAPSESVFEIVNYNSEFWELNKLWPGGLLLPRRVHTRHSPGKDWEVCRPCHSFGFVELPWQNVGNHKDGTWRLPKRGRGGRDSRRKHSRNLLCSWKLSRVVPSMQHIWRSVKKKRITWPVHDNMSVTTISSLCVT
jgi:hypothetical protein